MVSSNGNARAAIRGWLQENVTGGRDVPNDEPLIDNGVMTSLQTVELVVFLEDTFGIVVEDEEFDEENFGSVESIANLVESKAAWDHVPYSRPTICCTTPWRATPRKRRSSTATHGTPTRNWSVGARPSARP